MNKNYAFGCLLLATAYLILGVMCWVIARNVWVALIGPMVIGAVVLPRGGRGMNP